METILNHPFVKEHLLALTGGGGALGTILALLLPRVLRRLKNATKSAYLRFRPGTNLLETMDDGVPSGPVKDDAPVVGGKTVEDLATQVAAKLEAKRSRKLTSDDRDVILTCLSQVRAELRSDITDLKRLAFLDGPGPQDELRRALAEIQVHDQRARDTLALANAEIAAIEIEVGKVSKLLLGDTALLAEGPKPTETGTTETPPPEAA